MGLTSAKFVSFERGNVFGFFGQDGDWFSDSKHALVVQNFGNEPFISGLESNSGFIGFYFANGIPNFDLVTFLNVPLNDFTLSHCG